MQGFGGEYPAKMQAEAASQTRYNAEGGAMIGSLSQSLAGGVISGNKVSSPALAEFIGRAGDIHGSLMDIADLLTRHLDRILGPQPLAGESASISGKIVEQPHEVGQLSERIGNLDRAATRLRHQVERLARL